MLKRLVGLVVVVGLALSGTAHAADFDAAEMQAIIDKAVPAAGARFTVVQSQAPAPYPTSTEEQIVNATLFGFVGVAQTSLRAGTGRRTQGSLVGIFQSTTPELAQTYWSQQQPIAEKAVKPPNGPPTGFRTRKVEGHPVLFYERKVVSTTGVPATDAQAALVDGRNFVSFETIGLSAAKGRAGIRRWVAAYLK